MEVRFQRGDLYSKEKQGREAEESHMKIIKISTCLECPFSEDQGNMGVVCWRMGKYLEYEFAQSSIAYWCPLEDYAITNEGE